LEFVGLKVGAIVCVEKKLPLTVFVYEALPTGVIEPATDKVCDTDVVKDPDELASCVVVRVPVAATVVELDTEFVGTPEALILVVPDTTGLAEAGPEAVAKSEAEKGVTV